MKSLRLVGETFYLIFSFFLVDPSPLSRGGKEEKSIRQAGVELSIGLGVWLGRKALA